MAKVFPNRELLGWYTVHDGELLPAHAAIHAQFCKFQEGALLLQYQPRALGVGAEGGGGGGGGGGSGSGSSSSTSCANAAHPLLLFVGAGEGSTFSFKPHPFKVEASEVERCVVYQVFNSMGGGSQAATAKVVAGIGGGAAAGGGGMDEGEEAAATQPPPLQIPPSPAIASLESTLAALKELQGRVGLLQQFVASCGVQVEAVAAAGGCSSAASASAASPSPPTAPPASFLPPRSRALLRDIQTLLNKLPVGVAGELERHLERESFDALLLGTQAAVASGAAGLEGLVEKVGALGGSLAILGTGRGIGGVGGEDWGGVLTGMGIGAHSLSMLSAGYGGGYPGGGYAGGR